MAEAGELDARSRNLLTRYKVIDGFHTVHGKTYCGLCTDLVGDLNKHVPGLANKNSSPEIRSSVITIVETAIRKSDPFLQHVEKIAAAMTGGAGLSEDEFDRLCRSYAIMVVGEIWQ